MTDQPASGNRWEPRATDGVPDQQPDDTVRQSVVPPAGPAGAAPMTPPVRRRSNAARAGLVAAAAALFLAGGAGGYAIGAATSDDTPGNGVPGQDNRSQFTDRDGDGDHHGFGDRQGVPPGGETPQQQDGTTDGSGAGDDT